MLKKPGKIFYGWWIVIVSLVVDAIGQGTFQKGFTLYFLPLQRDLGLTSARYSMAQLLGRLEGGFQAPVGGFLIDRIGSGPLMVAGGVLMGLGFITLSFSNTYLYFVLVYVLLLSLGSRAGFNNASTAAVNQWFRRKRGMAMALVSTGNGVGGAAIVPLVTLMVTTLDWRTSAMVSGIVMLVTVVPLSLLVRRSPESMGLLPDGDRVQPSRAGSRDNPQESSESSSSSGQSVIETDYTVKEAMRTPSYWLLVFSVGLRDVAHSGLQWHIARLLVMSGVGLRTAGFLIGFQSFSTLIFNPFVGWLGDKVSRQRISAFAMLSGTVAMVVLLSNNGHVWELAIFVVLLAFSDTANPLAWAIMGDFFGRKSYATLRGWQHVPNQLMSMSTPVWMGLIFDRTNDFFWAVIPLAVVYGLSACFFWTLPKPKSPARLLAPSVPSTD